MPIQLAEQVEQKARKWEQLSQLLRDPEIYTFLSTEFSKNGTSFSASVQAVKAHVPQPSNKKGDVIKAVISTCKEIGPNTTFTTHDVLKKMEATGFAFGSKDHHVTVNSTLRKLAERPEAIKYQRQGSGRRASTYRLI